MRRLSAVALLIAIVVVVTSSAVIGTGSMVVSAEDDESGVLEPIRTITDRFVGFLGWAEGEFSRLTDESTDRDAAEAAADLQSKYNANSGDIEDWVNDRVDADASADVLELTMEIGSETETVFLVADVNDSQYRNSSVVDSTVRSVDERCTLEDDAARNAADELDTFVDEFVDEDRDVSSRYLGRLAGRYDEDVECSFDLDP